MSSEAQDKAPKPRIWERSAAWAEESKSKIKRLEEVLRETALRECTFTPSLGASKKEQPVGVGQGGGSRVSAAPLLRSSPPRELPVEAPMSISPQHQAAAAALPTLPLALRSSRVGWAVGMELASAAAQGDALEEARLVAGFVDRGSAPPPPPGAPPLHAARAVHASSSSSSSSSGSGSGRPGSPMRSLPLFSAPSPALPSTLTMRTQQQQQQLLQASREELLAQLEAQVQMLLKERGVHLAALHEARTGMSSSSSSSPPGEASEAFRALSAQNLKLDKERSRLMLAANSAARELANACTGFEAERRYLQEECQAAAGLVRTAEEECAARGAALAGARREVAALQAELVGVAEEREEERRGWEREREAWEEEREDIARRVALAQASATAAAANAASAAGLSSVCSPRAGATPFKVRDAAAAALGLLGAATRSHWDGEPARSSSSSSSGAAASTPCTPLAGPASGLLSQQAAAATEEADALALQGYADILEALAGEVTGLRASLAESQRAVLASEAERERLLGMTKSLEAQVGALMEQRESLTQSIESDSVHMAEALRGEGALGTLGDLGTLRAPFSLSYLSLSPPPTPPCAETRNSKEVLSAQISLLTAERAALLEETTAWRAREQALAVNWAPKSSAVLQLPPLPALPPQLMASKTFSSRAAAPPANVVIDAVAAAVEQVQQTPQQRRLQLLQQHQQQQSQQQPQQQQQLQQPQQPQQPISSITFNASRGGGGGSNSSSSNSSVSNTFSIASASRQDLASWEGQRRPSISDGVATVEYVPAVRRLPPLPPNK
jgi:hypothetical protein